MFLGAHLVSAAVLIAAWVLWVPRMVVLPPEVAFRIQFYPVFMLPIVALMLTGSYLWLRPLVREWEQLTVGSLSAERTSQLVSRAAGYPYHAFVVVSTGIAISAAAVAFVQKAAHGTETYLVVELLALACALGVVFAMISFTIGRAAVAPFLGVSGVVATGFRREPDLAKRIVLGLVCTVLVIGTVLAVMVFDAHTNTAASLTDEPVLYPAVRQTAVFLVAAGPIFLVIVAVLSSLVARDFSSDILAVADGLEALADAEPGGAPETLPVLSPDEVGELTEAFNRLATGIAKHDRTLRGGAARAKDAQLRQMEFFNVVSHDLRTPLHSIVGFSQLLLEGVEGELNPDQQEDVRNILNGAYHLLSLVDDVVDLSKMESGMMALSRRDVDIAHVVREGLEAASGLRKEQGVRLVADAPEDLPAAFADETRLRQILFNLVGNALKFTNDGEVRVRARREGADQIAVTVEDTGPGIPESSLDAVFEEFKQVREAGRRIKGTGLGLAITRRLVEMHGGVIQAANRQGGGAVFTFTLPVYRQQEAGT